MDTPICDGRASTAASAFRLEYAVGIHIEASADVVWAILTDGPGFARWNSTVQSLEGEIALGNTIALVSTLAPERTFKLKIAELVANERMVWSDGMAPMFKGVRTFSLIERRDGSTDFLMREVFSGFMLPMIKGSLPDFGPSFEAYAADLRREAELARARAYALSA